MCITTHIILETNNLSGEFTAPFFWACFFLLLLYSEQVFSVSVHTVLKPHINSALIMKSKTTTYMKGQHMWHQTKLIIVMSTLGSGVLGASCSELEVAPLRFPSRWYNTCILNRWLTVETKMEEKKYVEGSRFSTHFSKIKYINLCIHDKNYMSCTFTAFGGSGAEGASVWGLGLVMDDPGLLEPLVCVEGNSMLT